MIFKLVVVTIIEKYIAIKNDQCNGVFHPLSPHYDVSQFECQVKTIHKDSN